jgi:hypothetical protein
MLTVERMLVKVTNFSLVPILGLQRILGYVEGLGYLEVLGYLEKLPTILSSYLLDRFLYFGWGSLIGWNHFLLLLVHDPGLHR